jgi:hypothetical protein
MNLEEIIEKAESMTANDGYEFINNNIGKEIRFISRANGRAITYVGLLKRGTTYRMIMKRVNTNRHFHITSFKFFERMRRNTWTKFTLQKRKKLIL